MKLGFIGCGTITAAIVTGLSSLPQAAPIVVSPRSAKVAAALAARFSNVRVAATNQKVLDACDVVVLAVRPQVAGEVLPQLRFRADHHVVSLIAAVTLAYLKSATAPAGLVTRAVPVPAVARRQGPTAFYPPNAAVKAMFNTLGTAIELSDESEFDVFTSVTAIMASYFGIAGAVSDWMVHEGVAPASAHTYVSTLLLGLAGEAPANPDRSFAALTEEHQTKGGLNEQVLNQITGKGVLKEIARALDGILQRLRNANPK